MGRKHLTRNEERVNTLRFACTGGCWRMEEALYDSGATGLHHRNKVGITALPCVVQSSGGKDLVMQLVNDYGLDVLPYDIN